MFVHIKIGRFFETSKEVKSKQTIEAALRHKQVSGGCGGRGGGGKRGPLLFQSSLLL